MNAVRKTLLGFALMTGTLAAQNPSFTGVVNAGSNLPPGFPNSGLAQGCVFVIYGSNLGPANLVQATTLPFPTTAGLAGTVITITVGGTTTTAPIDYTSAGQVAAILPSTTPVGNGTLTLTYNGKSGSTPITVVASNFGIVTVNNSGSGPAVVTFANNQLITTTNSAKPGDELVLWGTGLGALPAGQSDALGAQGPLAVAPVLQVFVGGVSAQILYQARTPTAVGLDQINFVVPSNAPLGCNVSIIVQTTTPTATVSNGPTMSLASTDGATCADPAQVVPNAFLSKSSVKAAIVNIVKNTSLNVTATGTSTTTQQSATSFLAQFSQAQITSQAPGLNAEPTFGSCLTEVVAGTGGSNPPAAKYLDGGTSVTLTPPSAPAVVLPELSSGSLIIYQNKGFATAIPSGTWSFSNSGGSDVGALNFAFPVAAPVTWTNEVQISTGPAIDRTQPLAITWSGGDSNGYVDIQGLGEIGTGTGNNFVASYVYYFDCSSPTSASTFTIPPSAMLGMPTGANAFASIQVSTHQFEYTPAVTVPGFDGLFLNNQFQASAPVIFK